MLVIPVLIIVLSGAGYLRELHLGRARTRQTARACAWEIAMGGCEGAPPPSCTEVPSATGDSGGPDIAAVAKSKGDGTADPFGDFPILGEAFQTLFGGSTRAAARAHVAFPFDDERAGVASSETELMCNAVPREVLELAVEWLEEAIP